jgi:hypothetical protein
MRSVVDRNVVMRLLTVLNSISVLQSVGNVTGERGGMWRCKTSCTVLTGVEWPGREADHSARPSARSKMSGAVPPFPPPAFTVTKLGGVSLRIDPICLAAFVYRRL